MGFKKNKTAAKPRKKRTSGTCFTIMPFGGWFDDYYSTVFTPAIEESGLKSIRADDLYTPTTIVSDIWNLTKQAKIILADLSGKNPNVFYELGLAHALGKPVVLVVEGIDDVPFDLRALRVITYDKNEPNWGSLLTKNIARAIKDVLKNPRFLIPRFLIPRFYLAPNPEEHLLHSTF